MGGAQPALFGSLSLSIQPGQRHVAVRLVHVADDGAASALFDEAHAFPDEDGAAEAVVFGDPAPYGVVVEFGGLGGCVFGAEPSCSRYFNEAIFSVSTEYLIQITFDLLKSANPLPDAIYFPLPLLDPDSCAILEQEAV